MAGKNKNITKQKRSTSGGVTHLDGIQLSDGSYVLPGLSNSFHHYYEIPWHRRHKFVWMFILSIFIVFVSTFVNVEYDEYNEDFFEALEVSVDFGDIVEPFRGKTSKRVVEIDEVFGNQFVKDKDEVVDPNSNDYVIGQITRAAQHVPGVTGGALVLKSGTLQPPYPQEAINAGIEGKVFIEFVIGENGRVLQVLVRRGVDPILDKAAVRHFRSLVFQPVKGPDGKPMPVKIVRPVVFKLN